MALRDLDELILSCRNKEARIYIAEAVSSYKSGAYRSCIVATWVAVVFDLIAKIKELSISGDPEAKKISEDISKLHEKIPHGDLNAIKKALEIERSIIETAHEKFEFFGSQELLDLKRLRDDRNRCAHPTYQELDSPYSPSNELARAHLVHAVESVLSQPPMQGKAAIEQLLDIVRSEYFPTEVEAAEEQLTSFGLQNCKNSFLRGIVDRLIYDYWGGDSKVKWQKRTLIAIQAIRKTYPGTTEERLKIALNKLALSVSDKEFMLFFPLLRWIDGTWQMLEKGGQSKFIEYIKKCSNEVAVKILPFSLTIKELEIHSIIKFKTLEVSEMGLVLQKESNIQFVEHVLEMYCSSKSWDTANQRYENLIKPVLNKLTEQQAKRIMLAPTKEGADLLGSFSFGEFISEMYKKKPFPADQITTFLTENKLDGFVEEVEKTE